MQKPKEPGRTLPVLPLSGRPTARSTLGFAPSNLRRITYAVNPSIRAILRVSVSRNADQFLLTRSNWSTSCTLSTESTGFHRGLCTRACQQVSEGLFSRYRAAWYLEDQRMGVRSPLWV